jgi:hypothetical protein
MNSPNQFLLSCDAPSPPLTLNKPIIFQWFFMSNKLFKTTQLALPDFDLHFVESLSHLFLRDSKILSDFETEGARNFPFLCLFFYRLFQFLTIHNEPLSRPPFSSPIGGCAVSSFMVRQAHHERTKVLLKSTA